MQSDSHMEADIVIVGLGPAGLLASLFLGRKGYKVVGVDRWPTPYPLPRAVTMDHEIARTLAVLGINADDDPAIDHFDDHYYWLNAKGQTLLDIDWFTKAEDGWRNCYWFSQPDLEQRLRDIISSLPNVELRRGFEVTSLAQDEQGVTLGYEETTVESGSMSIKKDGRKGTLRGRFALGADGANSFMRRAVGYEFTDLDFHYDWIVVDVTPKVAPNLKTAHYQICDPVRPTSVIPGGPGRRRWEFMVLPGENPQDIAKPDKVWELLKPFGLSPDNAHLDRAVPWRFQGKHLEHWRAGRVLLLGDAAHLMPPFAGEGMCAAFRDVNNLMWRLDLVLQGISGPALLDEWSDERRDHVRYYIDFSVNLGRIICVTDPQEAADRDQRLLAEYAEQSKRGPLAPHRAVLGKGTWNDADKLAGRPSIQGIVAYRGRTGRFDDAVGRGWFLLTRVDSPSGLDSQRLEAFHRIGGQALSVGPRGSGAEVIDLEGTYTGWMQKHGVAHLLIRPDFFVATTALSESDLRPNFDKVMAKVIPS